MFLVVGGNSEIGAAVVRRLRHQRQPVLASTRRQIVEEPALTHFLDLAAEPATWHLPRGIAAACLCAAVARLGDCASDPARSRRINVDATVALADRLLAAGGYVLFLSSNQVFDGSRPFVSAAAERCPISEYGRQKAAAEAMLAKRMAAGAQVGILRLGKVIPPGMPLLAGWHEALAAGNPVNAFFDMRMAPTPVATVATAAGALMGARLPGIYQLTGPCDVTYLEAARHIARRLGRDEALVTATGASSIGLPPGSTPANTTLDSGALNDLFGIAAPDALQVVETGLEGHRL
jgi:dTDP-4-dehydrorhamnose reductase